MTKVKNNKKWTVEMIELGLEEYKKQHGRYPSTLDFDKVSYLPTSRMIQRNFGGIVALKKKLKPDAIHDYTKGAYRSKVASDIFRSAQKSEEQFYRYLTSLVEEVRVHEHKVLRPGVICCDFFIYTSAKDGFVIDIFYAQDMQSLTRIVHQKGKRYSGLPYKVYFVIVGNESITQNQIDYAMTRRKILLNKNIEVKSEKIFKEFLVRTLNRKTY